MKTLSDKEWKMKKVAEVRNITATGLLGQGVGHMDKLALVSFMQGNGYEPIMVEVPGFSQGSITAWKSDQEILAINPEGVLEDVSRKARPARQASSGGFNFKNWLNKQALYEGVQGYFVAQRRAWANCVKCKQDAGEGAQKAWDSCLEEFQKGGKGGKWAYDYASDSKDKIKLTAQSYQAQMGEYWEMVQQRKMAGKTTAEAVNEVLEDMENKGRRIDVVAHSGS